MVTNFLLAKAMRLAVFNNYAVVIIVFFLAQKYIIQGVVTTGLKG